jgi:hypothetical protein
MDATQGDGFYIAPSNGQLVEAWTAWHLPYPSSRPLKPNHRAYRDALRKAIPTLRTGGFLGATYTYQDDGSERNRDIENSLFYNVGTGCFRTLATRSLRFDRKDRRPAKSPYPLDFVPLAHVLYGIANKPTTPKFTSMIAECGPVICERGHRGNKASLWKLLKPSTIRQPDASRKSGEGFKVQLTISAPGAVWLNLVGVLKNLLDAFISAFHNFNGSAEDVLEIVIRLSDRYEWPEEEVRALILDPTNAVLGPCSVPKLYGTGVQWSPDDHLLTACEVIREPAEGNELSIRGRLFQ